jgi:hypothetical protein
MPCTEYFDAEILYSTVLLLSEIQQYHFSSPDCRGLSFRVEVGIGSEYTFNTVSYIPDNVPSILQETAATLLTRNRNSEHHSGKTDPHRCQVATGSNAWNCFGYTGIAAI